VAYSNDLKQQFLDVNQEDITAEGAVSKIVARQMAAGALRKTGADFALSVTGIAGPSGGTPGKPVGTVFIGLAAGGKVIVVRQFNPYDRETFKQVTSNQALELLRQALLKPTKSARQASSVNPSATKKPAVVTAGSRIPISIKRRYRR
jgi:nicotinamide-nucleotide amidase